MSNSVLAVKTNEISVNFKWRTRDGDFVPVDAMETRHLFFTLRMIWNHTMPETVQLREGNRYRFGAYYTKEYFVDAIKAICAELATRDDMAPEWIRQLNRMIGFISVHQIEKPKHPTSEGDAEVDRG